MGIFKTSIKPSSGYRERQVGLYEGKITEVTEEKSKAGTNYLSLTFLGNHQSGECDNVAIYIKLFPESTSEYCQKTIVELFTCLGCWDMSAGSDTLSTIEEIVGMNLNVIAQYTEEEYNGSLKKKLGAKTYLGQDFRTAYEISEGVNEPLQHTKDLIYVLENPVYSAKKKEVAPF